jgi:DNA repair ATPase RecN
MSRTEDYQQLLKAQRGARLYNVDLHVHTPASRDHRWGAAQPRDLIQAFVNQNLDLVAITDHSSGEWVDQLKEAARAHHRDNRNDDRVPVILGGVEVSVGGIHLTFVFPEDCGTSQIRHMLSQLHVQPDTYGDPSVILDVGVADAIRIAKQHGALAIGPHCDSNHGVVKALHGQPRLQALRELNILELRTGTDPEVRKRKIAYVRNSLQFPNMPFISSSDAHASAELIGGCYIKMAEPSFRGLQQIVYEPEMRVFPTMLNSEPMCSIIGVSVIGEGVYGNSQIGLSDGLNVAIGGRGAGKSALLDTIRYALGYAPRTGALRDCAGGHFHRIEGLYVEGTAIRVYYKVGEQVYCSERNVSIEFTRGRDPRYTPRNVPQLFRLVDGQFVSHDDDLSARFEILSQGEVQSLIEREVELMAFLDGYEPALTLEKTTLEQIKGECERLLQQITSVQAELNGLGALRDEQRQLEERRDSLARILNSPEFLAYQKAAAHRPALEAVKGEVSTFEQAVNALRGKTTNLASRTQTLLGDGVHELNQLSLEMRNLNDEAQDATSRVNVAVARVRSAMGAVAAGIRASEQALVDHLTASGQSGHSDLVKQQSQLEEKIARNKAAIAVLTEKEGALAALQTELDERAEQLREARKALRSTRQLMIRDLNEKLGGSIVLKLQIDGNRTALHDALDALLSGHGLTPKEASIAKLAEHFSGLDLYRAIRDRDHRGLSEVISASNASKVIALSGGQEFFSLAFVLHDDVPEVFLVKGGHERPLVELSHGEKVSALLPILMLESRAPLLIDQPEDDLDHAFITENIVEILRKSRGHRQMLVITHNPNIPVLGDAELILKIERRESAKRCEVVSASGLEAEDSMRALKLLEGGDEAFIRRSLKYRMSH